MNGGKRKQGTGRNEVEILEREVKKSPGCYVNINLVFTSGKKE